MLLLSKLRTVQLCKQLDLLSWSMVNAKIQYPSVSVATRWTLRVIPARFERVRIYIYDKAHAVKPKIMGPVLGLYLFASSKRSSSSCQAVSARAVNAGQLTGLKPGQTRPGTCMAARATGRDPDYTPSQLSCMLAFHSQSLLDQLYFHFCKGHMVSTCD